ncbi:hypothetical protein O1L55_15145 [Streptomyces albulus]|nr:hypothetical protein [Streptomyces noursei]
MTTGGAADAPLGRELLRTMTETGASSAMVYELAPDAPVLRLTALSGIPPPVLDPGGGSRWPRPCRSRSRRAGSAWCGRPATSS